MHLDFQFIRSGTSGNDWIIFSSNRQSYIDGKDNPYFAQQLKIMQYTGLRDKNGREIYEDDIVLIKGNYGGDVWYDECMAIIHFDQNEFIPYNVDDCYGVVWQDYNWAEFEVLGNAHEAQNLLKDIWKKYQERKTK